MLSYSKKNKETFLYRPVSIAPLAFFRVLFGGVMFAGMVRFILKGWVYEQYIMPKFYFTYYGFEWVKPLGEVGMYLLFGIVTLAAFLIVIGYFYRIASVIFFAGFTYIELIDKTNYLNHYYFISIISFLLMLMPAHKYFSLDVLRKPSIRLTHTPRWMLLTFQLQLGMVYFFAGVAKLNYDWLFQAMPLRMWLPPHSDLPLIGGLLDEVWAAYLFSWFGAIYDLSIPFFLFYHRTRLLAYFFVVFFHLMTAMLFPIGMFPYIMILLTLVFFPSSFHQGIINFFRNIGNTLTGTSSPVHNFPATSFSPTTFIKREIVFGILVLHFTIQLFLPFRYLLYPGQLFWTEQGFRFSWRVMLMEKAGTAFFYVTDSRTGKRLEVINSEFLTPNQEKMMATQPDMILQFAQFLEKHYRQKGIISPKINAESYVTLNGSGSRLFLDQTVDLTKERDSFAPKNWILPFSVNE